MLYIILPFHKEPDSIKHETISLTKLIYKDAVIIPIDDSTGNGKGWAIRKGIEKAKQHMKFHKTGAFHKIAFIDGDMDIHPIELKKLINKQQESGCCIVVGKKKISGMPSRRIITFLSRLWIKTIFGIPVETQTGIKLFDMYAIPKFETKGFAFDIEILFKAKKFNVPMCDVEIEANIRKSVSLKAIINTLIESIRIYVKYR